MAKKTKSSGAASNQSQEQKQTRSTRSSASASKVICNSESEEEQVIAVPTSRLTRNNSRGNSVSTSKKSALAAPTKEKSSEKSSGKPAATRQVSVEHSKRKVILSESESPERSENISSKNTTKQNKNSRLKPVNSKQPRSIKVRDASSSSSSNEENPRKLQSKNQSKKGELQENNNQKKNSEKQTETLVASRKSESTSASGRPTRSTRNLKKPVSYKEVDIAGSDFEDDPQESKDQAGKDDSDEFSEGDMKKEEEDLDDDDDDEDDDNNQENEDDDFEAGSSKKQKGKKKSSINTKKSTNSRSTKPKRKKNIVDSQESDQGNMVDEADDDDDGKSRKRKAGAKKESIVSGSKDDTTCDQVMQVIDVEKEQGKIDIEDQYEVPYYLTKAYIRDIEGRPISDPEYDGSTVFIPVQELNKETPLFQQYWKSKQMNYDKVVFFRFGRNFMCFFNDALLLKRAFDNNVSMWGKRPVATVYDNWFRLYVKELLDKYEKSCIVVDQIQFNDEKITDQDLIKIITKGTYTDFAEDKCDYNSRYLMCMVESGSDHSFGLTLVDCTTHQIYIDDIKNDPAGNQFRTILQKMKPVEVHSVLNNMSEQAKNICKTTCKPQFTIDKTFAFKDVPSIFEELKNEFRDKIPIRGGAAADLAESVQPESRTTNTKADKKMEIEAKNNQKKGDAKGKSNKQMVAEGEEESSASDGSEDNSQIDEENDDDGEEDFDENGDPRPTFTYGELSSDYPKLLLDIEDIYEKDKKTFLEKQSKKQNDMKDEHNPEDGVDDNGEDFNFDVEFTYYMTLQSLMLSLQYLRSLKLSDNVFRMGTFNLLDSNVQKSKSLHLDAHAIENLDIFEVNHGSEIKSEGSLMSFIDYTRTPFGRRMLKRWLAYPLKSIEQIEQRQEAVEDLMAIDGVVTEFDKKLGRLGDLERQISKVFNSSQKSRLKPSSFENFSSSRLKDAYQIAKDLRALEEILPVFADYKDNFKSDRLKKLSSVKDPEAAKRVSENHKQQNTKVSYLGARLLNRQRSGAGKKSVGNEQPIASELVGLFPDLKPFVELIESQLELDENGFCQPKAGADRNYDEVVGKIKRIYKKMNIEANFWRKKLNSFDIKLVKSKMQWEIQIPEHLVEGQKKPKELHLTSKIKGFSRFQSEVVIRLCIKLKKAEQNLQKALSPFCEKFFFQFYKNRDLLYQVSDHLFMDIASISLQSPALRIRLSIVSANSIA